MTLTISPFVSVPVAGVERRSPTRDVFPTPDRLQLRPTVRAVAIACQIIGAEWQRARQWQEYLEARQ